MSSDENNQELKKPKRKRQKVIQVVVTDLEKSQIEVNAKLANLSASQYLRELGLGYKPKSLVDVVVIQEIRSLKSDMNRVGGLLKNLMSGQIIDPKEIRSTVNGLLLDFSRNQTSLDILISKVRSKIKF
ncbi:plasmid mobilization protein [Acinetobacter soli]|uniref:plasmid mobilization protein n=1 Tax=Acinetobacter soli TaxID=487316 RepID=UPI00125D8560|nr:LysR family transcriptional regulator [Acinetobacter soli]